MYVVVLCNWRKWSTIAFSEVGGQRFNQRSSIMPTASQLIPPTRSTTAEPCFTATDAPVTRRARRKRGAPRGKPSAAATKSRSRRRTAWVKDHRQVTRRLRHALFRRLERGSGHPGQRSHPVLRLGGLAQKENFSKQNKQIVGNGGGGGVSQRNVCRLGSFNCRTLLPVWLRSELAAYALANNVDILAIQERHIHFDTGDPVRHLELGKGWLLLAASASAAGMGGVGFIVSPKVRHAIDSYNTVSPRILRLQLSSGGQLKTVMFSIYSPTSLSDLHEADSFYHHLSDNIVATPRRHMLLVCGDFNATLALGNACSSHCPQQKLNRHPDLLRDLADGADLVAINTQLQKPRYHLVTFNGPRGRQACLDHILVRRKWCSSFLDCESEQVHNVKSDHTALIFKCRWHLATKKTKVPCCTCRDGKTLYQSQGHCAEFISHVKCSCRGANGEVKYPLFAKPSEAQPQLFHL